MAEAVRTKKAVWVENSEDLKLHYPVSYQTLSGQGVMALCALPLVVGETVIGGLSITFKEAQTFPQTDRDYLQAIAQQCAQALNRAQLTQAAEKTAVEYAASEERQRLARELHDAVSQTLFSATTIGQSLPALWERSPERAFEQLQQMVVLNRAAMAEMRTLLLELRPEAIVRTTLSSLLVQLTEALQGRRRLKINLTIEGDEVALPPEVHLSFYRVAQESLNNAIKHSQATEVDLRLTYSAERLTLYVADNGRGFDMSRTTPGFGLGTMQERAETIKAVLQIKSVSGHGTQVILAWTYPQVESL